MHHIQCRARPSGYEMYLKAIADPREPNHEAMREWDDPDFDPTIVDVTSLRCNLANLAKYPGRRTHHSREFLRRSRAF